VLEELQLLIRLQQIDNQLMEIELEKGDLPEQISVLSRETDRFTSTITDAEKTLSEVALLQKQHESNLEAARDRLKKSQNTIYSVKTTREYDAISSEIEQAKHVIADSEKLINDQNARQEDARKVIEDARIKLAVVKEELDDKQAEMRERMEISQDEELKMQHEREKILVRLKKPVYAHYDRIRKIRDGVGVSHLVDGACSYCCSRVPPQRQAEIRRMDDLILCEVCSCVIVGPEEMILR